jgi:Mbeg1-like
MRRLAGDNFLSKPHATSTIRQMSANMSKFKFVALLAIPLTTLPTVAFAEHGFRPGTAISKLFGVVTGQTREIDEAAAEVYANTPRVGSCDERRERFLQILPDALRFGRYARDIYEEAHEAEMAASGVSTLDLGEGRSVYFKASGRRYAEVRIDTEHKQAVVVFRGTRLSVGSDVSTDVLSFIGVETAYYSWASSFVGQVVREHPGMEVVVTGQSLGGGLALYAVLKNPGVKGFAFNPAGLSLRTWTAARSADRARTNAAVTVIATRSARHIEPVTAVSLAGRSVLPGHVYVIEAEALIAPVLHSASTVVTALERVNSENATGSVCDGDLGELAAR